MRDKARLWWSDWFWPEEAADYLKIDRAYGTHENHMLRQVVTCWGMAASFVLDGTLSENAFLKPRFSQEMLIVFAKQSGLHG
jgi:hypothetical protein